MATDENTKVAVKEFLSYLIRGDEKMPILYYLPPSPPCRAVLLLGRLIGLEFDLRAVNIIEGEHMKPEFVQVNMELYCCHQSKNELKWDSFNFHFYSFQINPQHCIPTLDDQGIVLWER